MAGRLVLSLQGRRASALPAGTSLSIVNTGQIQLGPVQLLDLIDTLSANTMRMQEDSATTRFAQPLGASQVCCSRPFCKGNSRGMHGTRASSRYAGPKYPRLNPGVLYAYTTLPEVAPCRRPTWQPTEGWSSGLLYLRSEQGAHRRSSNSAFMKSM